MELSVVIPAHNESAIIKESITKTLACVEGFADSFEVIVLTDGSTDGTDVVVDGLASQDLPVVHLGGRRRLGKGGAFSQGLKIARGDILILMDADLSTDLACLPMAVQKARETGAIIIGTRNRRGARVRRSLTRTFASLVFNLMVRFLFRDGISDHQIGFKVFSKRVASEVLPTLTQRGFLWDTEFLVKARRRGYRVVELPVSWRERDDSKVHLLTDALRMFLGLFELWRDIRGCRSYSREV